MSKVPNIKENILKYKWRVFMIRIDYLLNKMIEEIDSATILLEDIGLENTEDLFVEK